MKETSFNTDHGKLKPKHKTAQRSIKQHKDKKIDHYIYEVHFFIYIYLNNKV